MIGGDEGRVLIRLVFERRGVDLDDLLTCLRPTSGRPPRSTDEKRKQLAVCVDSVYDLVGPSCIADEFSDRLGFRISEKRVQRIRALAKDLRVTHPIGGEARDGSLQASASASAAKRSSSTGQSPNF